MQKPDISIVIVNYNVKDFLKGCLDSIENAKSGFEVQTIVVDNNSNDGSVEALAPQFPSVEFIALKENLGFAKANNLGFEKAGGKYILILNPDTILSENTLEKMYSYMENHPETGIAGCKVLNADGTFQLACRRGFPTPWAAFTKLFGLQKLFPNSKLFAKYNQTYKSIDETYFVDAVIGAFMFARREAFDDIHGFDADFFMYGEDLDMCFRATQKGWKVAYVHETSIIHYKGESARRSSMNDVKEFYRAMEIFVQKHYGKSSLFLGFLKLGIWLRSGIAYFNKFRRDILLILFDLLAVNFSLLLATKIRFEAFLAFPDYAYPTVFVVISLVVFFAMVLSGEYFERRRQIRKAVFSLLVSFFLLSSLTYFFKEFAFSRGVLLMTIGFSIFLSSGFRIFLGLIDKIGGKDSDKRIAIAGINKNTELLISKIQASSRKNLNIIGIIGKKQNAGKISSHFPFLGNVEQLPEIIEKYKLQDIIITDLSFSKNDIMKTLSAVSNPNVKFHIAQQYDEFVSSQIMNEISGLAPTAPQANYSKFRNKALKRSIDIALSFLGLTIGFPILYLLVRGKTYKLKKIWKVFTGKYSFVGAFELENEKPAAKPGLTGLAHISKPEALPRETVNKLNEYYFQHYSISLDIDIFLKYIFRK